MVTRDEAGSFKFKSKLQVFESCDSGAQSPVLQTTQVPSVAPVNFGMNSAVPRQRPDCEVDLILGPRAPPPHSSNCTQAISSFRYERRPRQAIANSSESVPTFVFEFMSPLPFYSGPAGLLTLSANIHLQDGLK